jgi:pyruvate/2-oxoglutarate/acetoin dehydrogenase E1 component
MSLKTMNYGDAIAEGMVLEMRRDPLVYIAGEDVGVYGGGFGVTRSAWNEFGPSRVFDTPISESAIVGHAVGAAAAGLKPVIEIMFMDFMEVCFDEMANQAAKMRYMFGGKATLALVLRTPCGGGLSAAAQHSQCLEALIAHTPGLKLVMPATPADAKGLIMASIRDDNPVVYAEHKGLYAMQGEVPEGEYIVPLGKADVKREGSDVTVVTWSAMVGQALMAADLLAADGINVEVIDLRSLVPLDKEAIMRSVEKTGRLVVAQEAVKTCGFAAEVSAIVTEEGFDLLDAPIKRVTAPDTPVPFGPGLEAAYMPNAEDIRAAVLSL